MNSDMSNFQAVVASLTVEGEACDLTQPKLLLGMGTEKEIAPFIHKVGATPIAEIDRLIAELRQTKEHLQSERQRVEAEMLRYTNLAEMASATAKIISDAVSNGILRACRENLGRPTSRFTARVVGLRR
jgi:hypothetical protein